MFSSGLTCLIYSDFVSETKESMMTFHETVRKTLRSLILLPLRVSLYSSTKGSVVDKEFLFFFKLTTLQTFHLQYI